MDRKPFAFRHRSTIIIFIYLVGFLGASFDHVNAAVSLAGLIAHSGLRLGIWFSHHREQVIFALAGLFALAAAAFRTWGVAYLKSEVVHDDRLHTERVVADGPYRYVRNPLYLGSVLLAIGLGSLASRLGWVIIVACSFALYWQLIMTEEEELLRDQGEFYRAYCRAVPRLLPAWRPQVPEGGAKPMLCQAFRGELMMWLFAASILGYALTLRIAAALALIYAGLAEYAIDRVLQSRAARAIS